MRCDRRSPRVTDAKARELRELRARVTELEAESRLLGQRTESLVLLAHARRAFESAETLDEAFNDVSEVCGALTGVENTCVMLRQDDSGAMLRSHCGGQPDSERCPVFDELAQIQDVGAEGAGRVIENTSTLRNCRLVPSSALVVPFERPTVGSGLLLFASDSDGDELRRQQQTLDELAVLLVDLMESRALRDALRDAKENLERQVGARTSELRNERARLEATLENAADAIAETALDGRLLSANGAFARMLGYTKEELLQTTWMAVTHPDDVPACMEELDALHAGRIPYFTADKRYMHKGGAAIHTQVRVSVVRSLDGQVDRYVTIIRDLTETREAERDLRQLRHAVEQSRDAIVLTDVLGRIRYVNDAFEENTGFSLSEVRGKTPRVLRSGKQDDAFYQDLWRTISSGRTWQSRFTNRRKDGTLFVEESTITPVLDGSGEVEGYVAIKRDLTDRLALEEQLRQSQKLEAIGQLAGGIAHDFNNLLMPVLVDGEMLADSLAHEDPRRELADEIVEAAERARGLTRQLLAFGRKQMLEMRPVNLAEVVPAFGRVLGRVLREDVHLTFEDEHVPAHTVADAGQLEQILMNLVVNAQDAMPQGGDLTIRVLHEAETPDDIEGEAWVAFEVTDSGTGMDEVTLRRAIEPFFTTKDRGKGTGLGLATCHGIARQHGGDLTITSEVGRGTSIRVTLPAVPPEEGRTPTPTRLRRNTPRLPKLEGRHIWLVEDDDAVARSTERILRRAGAEVECFHDAAELLNDLSALTPADLLVTDVVLPGMDGRQLHETLRRTYPALPVIYVSGYPDDVLAPRGVLGEGIHFVQKPFESGLLLREVQAALAGGHSEPPPA